LAISNPALKTGSKYADLKRRLWFLLGALIVYRIGTTSRCRHQRERAGRAVRQQEGGILGLFNVFRGALQRFSILALGIMRTSRVDHHAALYGGRPLARGAEKEGEAGRRKITQYTRYATLASRSFRRSASRSRSSAGGLVLARASASA